MLLVGSSLNILIPTGLNRSFKVKSEKIRTNVDNKSSNQRPKHFSIEEVTPDNMNFIPADPPGKYDMTQYVSARTYKVGKTSIPNQIIKSTEFKITAYVQMEKLCQNLEIIIRYLKHSEENRENVAMKHHGYINCTHHGA